MCPYIFNLLISFLSVGYYITTFGNLHWQESWCDIIFFSNESQVEFTEIVEMNQMRSPSP